MQIQGTNERGEHKEGEVYNIKDVVSVGDAKFLCIVSHLATPKTHPTNATTMVVNGASAFWEKANQ